MRPAETFPNGLLRPELFLGVVSGLSASQARVELSAAGKPSGSHFEANRYGRGEVGELVLVEGQLDLVLARLVDVRLPDAERRALGAGGADTRLDATGFVQFLGTVSTDTLSVSAGVANYPRLGDRVYAAPHRFVGLVPRLMARDSASAKVDLTVGHVSGKSGAPVTVRPEKLFGRHCAVLGATGGGKSWTVATLLEQSAKHNAKILLLDATGEYRSLKGPHVVHHHLGQPLQQAEGSSPCSIPPSNFDESDFIALFEPSGKVQGPKLREAMKSLRLLERVPTLASPKGVLVKAKKKRDDIEKAFKAHIAVVEDPRSRFDPTKLARQITEECVYPDDRERGAEYWGGYVDNDRNFCFPLQSRISLVVSSTAFGPVFAAGEPYLDERINAFLSSPSQRILRLCLSGVTYEYRARQFIANAIGRMLLRKAREECFVNAPLVVFVDEAHSFLGQTVGYEDAAVRLDAFELIAREGRKYGLNLCLATQRPRDLTEGVLSQIGTLIVHRLTNDRDREIVERACGEVDRSVTAFLANLRQGEAAILGVDFPIPLTVQIARPATPPESSGPDYQKAWGVAAP